MYYSIIQAWRRTETRPPRRTAPNRPCQAAHRHPHRPPLTRTTPPPRRPARETLPDPHPRIAQTGGKKESGIVIRGWDRSPSTGLLSSVARVRRRRPSPSRLAIVFPGHPQREWNHQPELVRYPNMEPLIIDEAEDNARRFGRANYGAPIRAVKRQLLVFI